MIKIDLKMVKKLRQETGIGIMNCRLAFVEAKGNYSKALQLLKKKQARIAEKKSDRETKAGLVEAYIHADGRIGALVKLSCETDFVSRNKEFKKLAHELAMQVAAMDPKNVSQLLKQVYIRDPEKKVSDLIKEAIGKLKENIKVDEILRSEV